MGNKFNWNVVTTDKALAETDDIEQVEEDILDVEEPDLEDFAGEASDLNLEEEVEEDEDRLDPITIDLEEV